MKVDQKGNSIMGVVVALGCVALMVSASSSFLLNARKTTNTMMQINVRDKIQNTLKMVIRTPTSIALSQAWPENAALRSCLRERHTFDDEEKGDCLHHVEVPFTLYGPMKGSGKIGGKSPEAVEYNTMGAAVNKVEGEVPVMSVKSFFKAQCPAKTYDGVPSNECDVPEAIEITYVMETRADDIKKTATLKKFRESVVYPISELSNFGPAIGPKIDIPDPNPTPKDPPPGPPPSGGGGGGLSGGGTPSPAPPPKKPPPIDCVGETIQVAPNKCACPPGQVLVWPKKGKCMSISV